MKYVILGILDTDNSIYNFVILHAKQYIFNARCNDHRLNVTAFNEQLKNIYTLLKSILRRKMIEWKNGKENGIQLICDFLLFNVLIYIYFIIYFYLVTLLLLSMFMGTVTSWEQYENKSIGHRSVVPCWKEKKNESILMLLWQKTEKLLRMQ